MAWRFAPALLGTRAPRGWRPLAPGAPTRAARLRDRAAVAAAARRGGDRPAAAARRRGVPGGAGRRGRPTGDRRLTVTGTHLSFVPRRPAAQLRALLRRLDRLGGRRLLLGDLNLCWPLVRALALAPAGGGGGDGTFRNRPGGAARPRVQLDHVLAARRGAPRPAAPAWSAAPPPTTWRSRSSWTGADVGAATPGLVPLTREQLAAAWHLVPARAAGADDRPAPARHRQRQLPGRPLAGPAGPGGGDRRQLGPGRRPGRARPGGRRRPGRPGSSRPRRASSRCCAAAAGELHEWPRVIFTLEGPGRRPPGRPAASTGCAGSGRATPGRWPG